MTCLVPVLALLSLVLATAAGVESFVPERDDVVLERLPESPLAPRVREQRALQRELAQDPRNPELAARLAWHWVERGRDRSEPRYYGYAQAALAPWWDLPDAPVPILVLRATIRQHYHDFSAALHDLDAALARDPDNAQAWLTQAVIHQVRGEYDEARRSCVPLLRLTSPLTAVSCAASVASLTGEARKSYELLERALRQSRGRPGERLWALTLLAEIASRLDRAEDAERYFRQALALGPDDAYLLGAYADFLLERRRFEEVVALLAEQTQIDHLLLRLAIAERMLGDARVGAHVQTLQARFRAAHERGDAAHGREQSRLALHLLDDARGALELAESNWAAQREPADARILLEAALAAREPQRAQPVLDLMARSRLEDAALERLRAALERREGSRP